MNLAEKAVAELFPNRDEKRKLVVKYSGKFADYNANVKYTHNTMEFSLSKKWQDVSEEIQQGIIEHLLCKVYGEDVSSVNQDLYHSFMKHLTKFAPISEQDEYLLGRFSVINDQYFNGMMTAPNLKWGQAAYRKLGHYEYASDTIVISGIFKSAMEDGKVEELLDFVMYHEMLHKKHQYNHRKKGAHHHTKAFKEDEKKWHDNKVEDKLKRFLAGKRLKRLFMGW